MFLKGGKIQATVKNRLIRRFSNVLEEGQCHIVANFGVGQSNGNYRISLHPYKINFFFNTSVRVCDEDLHIPIYGFSFVSFEDILENKLDDKFLVGIPLYFIAFTIFYTISFIMKHEFLIFSTVLTDIIAQVTKMAESRRS